MKFKKYLQEKIEIDIEIGDTILGGRFKNKRIVVKEIGQNEKGDITINGKPLLKYRLIPREEIEIEEALGTNRPRSGGGKWGDFITARLKYYEYLMKEEGKSDKEAFKIVKDLTPKDLKKLGFMK